MVTTGVEASESIAIGRLRQRYGCPGPGRASWKCPWAWVGSETAMVDRSLDIPLLRRGVDDGRKSPGQMP